ncbi:MAG: hypothetical protein HWN65_13130 [Candidatus Helarchaeota archaeon]|nr:hypothetical protein [Candidatus Helarchaeota archaeon]
MAAGTADGKVIAFNRSDSTPLWTYTTAPSGVWGLAFSSDGSYLTAGNLDSVYLFNINSSAPVWSPTVSTTVRSAAISADGQSIAVGVDDGRVLFFHLTAVGPDDSGIPGYLLPAVALTVWVVVVLRLRKKDLSLEINPVVGA